VTLSLFCVSVCNFVFSVCDCSGGCSTVFSFLVVAAAVGGEVFHQGVGRLLVGHTFGP
jgi:hypothetical protein